MVQCACREDGRQRRGRVTRWQWTLARRPYCIDDPILESGWAELDSALYDTSAFWVPEHVTPSGWLEHAPFAFWLIGAMRPRTLVELGTHSGYSYFAFCQAVQRHKVETRSFAIDTWEGDEHAGFYGEEVFEAVSERNRERYSDFSTLIRSTFDDALAQFDDASIDLLHIDGRHLEEDVRHDFETWRPKLSDRSVVLLHDTNVRERNFGVYRYFEEIAQQYPSFAFEHGHGLGVVRTGARTAPSIDALFRAVGDIAQANGLREVYASLGERISQRVKISSLETSVAKERVRVEELLADQVAARKATVELERSRQQIEAELAGWRREVAEMTGSRSWRITRPLRSIGNIARSLSTIRPPEHRQ